MSCSRVVAVRYNEKFHLWIMPLILPSNLSLKNLASVSEYKLQRRPDHLAISHRRGTMAPSRALPRSGFSALPVVLNCYAFE